MPSGRVRRGFGGPGQDQMRETAIAKKSKRKKHKTHKRHTFRVSDSGRKQTTLHTYTCIPTTFYILGTEGNGDKYIPLGLGHFGQDVAAIDTPSLFHFPVSHTITLTHYLSLSWYPSSLISFFPFSQFFFPLLLFYLGFRACYGVSRHV